jgi:hypothetical protein
MLFVYQDGQLSKPQRTEPSVAKGPEVWLLLVTTAARGLADDVRADADAIVFPLVQTEGTEAR